MPEAEMTDTYGGPFSTEPVPWEGRLKTNQLAEIVAERPDDVENTAFRLRGYISRGYLHPRGVAEGDNRKTLLFDPHSALTAAALIAIADTQLRNSEVLAKVAFSLQTWRAPLPDGLDQPGAPKSPAEFIWHTFLERPETPPGFSLHVQWRRHLDTGRLDVAVALAHDPHGYLGPGLDLREKCYPTLALVMPLDLFLPRLCSRTGAFKAN